EDGRIVVVKSGTLTLRTADTFDTGLYHCIGTNDNDADVLTFRITVVDPHTEHNSVNGAQLSALVGSTLYLPCTSTAVPEAAISWVLPELAILHHSVRNRHIFDNGTLRIQRVTERDSGYFKCVAANQYGVDLLVFQVLVKRDKTTLKENQVAVGGWEEGDGSGHAMTASATAREQSSATPATLTAHRGSAASASRNRAAQRARNRSSHGKMTYRHYRDKSSRRFRGPRRQFVSSARRVDPQRWAAFLEKTKRNSTLIEKQGEGATKAPLQVHKFSEVPGDEEETSGDLRSPEEEFTIPVTATATAPALRRAVGSVRTAGPKMPMSNTPAWKPLLLVAEAEPPLPSPFSQPVSLDSRRPQTSLNPTIKSDLSHEAVSQTSVNGLEQPTASNGASGTSTPLPAGQRLVYPGESSNQHLKPVSATPRRDVTVTSKPATSQNAVEKVQVFTESVDKISTQTDDQIAAVTVSEPSPESGHVYFHSTQKQVTPKPPSASPITTDQQMWIIQDVTTHTPQAQKQYGRQRKIPSRRRIVRPGHIPSMKEPRYNFGRPSSVRGSTAVAAGVQLNMKNIPHLPAFNNLSSSINPFSSEAPLSSPSTVNTLLEHPAGTHRSTAFLGEEEKQPSARQKATATVVPFSTRGTQDTPPGPSESSARFAPFQTNTDGVQPFSIRPAAAAIHTAPTATEVTRTISTKISSTPESVSPSIAPGTSPKSSQTGKITWECLFEHGTPREVPKKLPKQQTDMFPSTEVSTALPKTAAALATSRTSPLCFTPISAGGNHNGGVLSLNMSFYYSNGESEEHLPPAQPPSSSNPATSATKEMDGKSLKPTVTPMVTPQTNTKITKSKTFRMGRRRGQRRKRPHKILTSQSVAAGHSPAASPSVDAATPVVTTVKPPTTPTSSTPAEPLVSVSSSVVSVTETPAPWIRSTPEAPQHVPTAATQTPVIPVTWRDTQSAVSPPDSRIAESPTTPIQTTPRLSKPFSTTGTRLTTVCATSGSERAQQVKATTAAGEKSHLKTEERAIQENPVAQPMFPARIEPRTRAPAAATDVAPPSAQQATPPP
ncbi:IGS10 protein, partial [Baryphthengus martii]|nr:IGS10 protein [Baryphthengus martii]